MRVQRFLLLPVASACLFAVPALVADTVHLKNGRQIEGRITDNRQTSGEVIVEIGTVGRVILRASEVDKVQKGEVGEVLQRERVAVKIPGGEYYNLTTSTVEGALSAKSDETAVVLDVADGLEVRIPRGNGVEVKKIETAAEPKPAAAIVEEGGKKKIRTTHAVYLKNGRKLQGSLVPTAETEPVKLDIGAMGRMTIARDKIATDGIKAEPGAIDIPEEPQAPAAPPAGQPQATPQPAAPQTQEEMRRQMREEILRELLDQMIEEKVGAAAAGERAAIDAIESARPRLEPEQVAAIQQAVSELGRQRNQNRVRAERQLVAMGADVLPYLEEAVAHPFELTRRAVQRIVRDIGNLRGAPIAIDALTDTDGFVRALAHEALVKILPSTIAYRADAAPAARLRAQAEYQHLWDNMVLEHARDQVLKGLAAQK
jgi:sRNA-binding regulator protein Hfq